MTLSYEVFKEHIYYILNYWKGAVDYERGGIHFLRHQFESEAERRHTKSLLMHVRQIYNYSVGYKYAFPGAEDVASNLYETLDSVFDKIEGVYKSISGDTMHFYKDFASSYDLFYTVIGLSKYAKIFKNKDVYEKAKSLFFKTKELFSRGDYALDGVYTFCNLETGERKNIKGNAMLHHFEALVNLTATAKDLYSDEEYLKQMKKDYDKVYDDSHALFTDKLFNREYMVTPEHFEDDFTLGKLTYYGNVTLAHVLEWLGFFWEAEQITGKRFPFLDEDGLTAAEKTFERAFSELGAFRNHFYLHEQLTSEASSFWGQTEAILNALFLYRKFREDKFLKKASHMADFYFKYYIDDEFGGIVSSVSDKGVVLSRDKGSYWKCDHHSLRMCEKILDYSLLDPIVE